MFFIVFKGSLGKEVFLTDFIGLNAIHEAFKKEELIQFVAFDPKDLEVGTIITRKFGAIYGYDVKPEHPKSKGKVK